MLYDPDPGAIPTGIQFTRQLVTTPAVLLSSCRPDFCVVTARSVPANTGKLRHSIWSGAQAVCRASII